MRTGPYRVARFSFFESLADEFKLMGHSTRREKYTAALQVTELAPRAASPSGCDALEKSLEIIAGIRADGLLLPGVEIIQQACGRRCANEKKPDVNWTITRNKFEACQALADVHGRGGLAAGIAQDGTNYGHH